MKHKFYKGQKVVCINIERESGYKCSLKLGEVYTIYNQYKCSCGSDQLVLEEEKYRIYMICACGHFQDRSQSYYEFRFRPYVVS
jgi:hypothetical protein